MALTPDEFDRPELRLPPEFHRAQAEMAAERGEEYDPEAFEDRIAKDRESWPDLDAAQAVNGQEDRFAEWIESGE